MKITARRNNVCLPCLFLLCEQIFIFVFANFISNIYLHLYLYFFLYIFFLYKLHIYSHTWNKYGGALCCVTVNDATNISQLLFMFVDIDATNYICIPIHPFSHKMDFCLSNFFSFNKPVICVFVQHV